MNFIKNWIKNNKQRILSAPSKKMSRMLLPFVSKKYSSYDSQDFIERLKNLNIECGDCVFVMYSQDRIYLKSGQIVKPNLILNDLISYLGSEGTIMMLCFSMDRAMIISKKNIFDINRTPTDCGILSEVLRRKSGSFRSLHPVFSAVAYGKYAEELCSSHHCSKYPFDENSPYYKLMENGGKYLGIGVGFEAFTPCHMVEDNYKEKFKHKIYYDREDSFTMIDHDKQKVVANFLMRNPLTFPGDYDPLYYFSLLKVNSSKTLTRSGISLFSFEIKDFFDAAIRLYDTKQITVWDTGALLFTIRRSFKEIIRAWIIS